jgi:hypothetical protein
MVTSNPWANKDQNSVASLIAVSSTDGVTIVRLWADPITHRLLVDNAGSGGHYSDSVLTATGIVNGLNSVFSFTSAPNYIVSDGATYPPLDNNGNVQWSIVEDTVTMTIPPSSILYGLL